MGIWNRRQQPAQILKPISFHIQIFSELGSRPLIWEGILPDLTGTLNGNKGYAAFSFYWNQHDADDKQVPAGEYLVRVSDLPMTISYRMDGNDYQAMLYGDSHTQTTTTVLGPSK